MFLIGYIRYDMNLLNCLKAEKVNTNFDLLPDGIFVLEQDGRIVDVNNKVLEIFKARKFDIIGNYFSDFVEDGTNVLNDILQDNRARQVKSVPKAKDEMPCLLEVTVNRNLELDNVYVCVRNVTAYKKEQKVITEKYEVAQKIIEGKNEFLIEASGGVLSNLTTICGFSRALLDGIGGALSEKQEKYLKLINTNSKDLSYDLEKLFTLFRAESKKFVYNNKMFDLISLIKSIERVYKKDIEDRKIIFSLDYSKLTERDCYLDSEIVEYILRSIMDIFIRFANLGKCSLNIGHPPVDFLKTMDFEANDSLDSQRYVLVEAKITDLVFSQEELDNIFNTYYKSPIKRPIGLKASLNLLKSYITDFKGDIWVYSKQNFGTMFTFVLPLR